MDKKFLVIGMAAILGASLSFFGCSNGANTTYVDRPNEVTMPVDTWAPDTNGLIAALANPDSGVVGVKVNISLDKDVKVPVNRVLVIYSEVATNTASLVIENGGKVLVGASGKLTATDSNHKVTVNGTLEVYSSGTLSTGATADVVGLNSNKVVFKGGTLKITGTVANLGIIQSMFNYVNNGTLDLSTAALTNIKTSELARITGVTATRRLIAKATASDAGTSIDNLMISEGAEITANGSDTLAGVKVLTVKGTLNLDPAATLAAATAINVSGTLDFKDNTGLNLTAMSPSAIVTSGKGVIKSATGTSIVLQYLLAKAGSALNIEQTAAVSLSAATEVKAGTTLTLGNGGTVTAGNDPTKKLIVAGKLVLNGGSLTTSTDVYTTSANHAINIIGDGRIEAGNIVISGAGSLYDAKSGAASVITISKNDGFVGLAGGVTTLNGAININAGKGKVILSVDGGAGNAVFTSAAGNGALKVTANADSATVTLDNGIAVAAALTIGEKGSLTVGANGIIAIKGVASTLPPAASNNTAKFEIKAGAKLSVDGVSNGNNATFTAGTFANNGTFATGSVGTYIANGSGAWTKK